MPQFFDRNNLTPEQQSRWDSAMAEYARVQDANLDCEIEVMSPEEQNKTLVAFRQKRPGDTLSLREHMKMFRGFMGGSAGDSKSALFARLLNGKPALPSPPPTSFSYPWYAIIEEVGPFRVSIGGVPTLGGQMRGTGGAEGQFAIGINQCAWAVVSLNDASRRLMDLQDTLSATVAPEKECSFSYRHTWTPELLDNVLAAYAAGPEFIVRYGRWAEYRLSIGRGEATCQRGYLKDTVAEIASRQCDHLSTCGSVFDVGRLHLHWEEGEVTNKGQHPRERLEQAKTRLAQLETGEYQGFAGLDRMMIDNQRASLEKEVAEFEADPTRTDYVRITYDDWVLEKASQGS